MEVAAETLGRLRSRALQRMWTFFKSDQKKTLHLFCVEVDIAHGPQFDLNSHRIQQEIINLLKSHQVKFIWMGTPCNSWSRARKWDGRGPGPLRDDHEGLMGLPNLSDKDQHKVKLEMLSCGSLQRFFVFAWLWIFQLYWRIPTPPGSGCLHLLDICCNILSPHMTSQIFVKMGHLGENVLGSCLTALTSGMQCDIALCLVAFALALAFSISTSKARWMGSSWP